MVEVIAYTQDAANTQIVLDLYGDEVIPLKYNIESIVNPDELNTSYSKQFDLPATKNNNRFFKAYYDVTTGGNFNPYKKVDVIIRTDSIEIFKGIMQVYSITHKGGVSTYTVNIFSSVVNLYDEIRDLTLNDIDFSNLSHLYTLSNIASLSTQSSINNILGSAIPTKVLYYPWCNWGYVYDGTSGTSSLPLDEPPNMQAVFRPWIQLKYVWDKIFEGSSFTYSSSFLSNARFTELYMDCNWGDDSLFITANQSSYLGVAKISSSITPTTSFTTLVYDNEVSDDYDIYDNTTGIFTAPNDNCKLIIDTTTRFNWFSANDEITIRLEHNSTHPLAPPSPIDIIEVPTSSPFPYEESESNLFDEIWLNNGETCQIKVKKSAATHADTVIDHNIGSSGSTNATGFNLGIVSGHVQDIQQNLRANHGKIKQLDFLKDIVKRFNLVITVDEANANNLIIEPYSNWIDDGSTIDWSSRIDDDEYKIEVPDNYRRFKLSDAIDGNDVNLKRHANIYGCAYGAHIKNNTEIDLYDTYEYDFAEGVFSSTIYKPFSTATTTNASLYPYLYPMDFPIPHIYGDDFSRIASKPRIGYYTPSVDISTPSSVISPLPGLYSLGFNDSADATAVPNPGNTALTTSGGVTAIPTISPYFSTAVNQGVLSPGLANIDINYGVENWYYLGSGNSLPINTVYNTYWHRYLNERYNKDVKILKINADLSSADIHELKFNHHILIKGQKYYILSVEHYPNTDKLSKLELIKVNNQVDSGCPAVAYIQPLTGLVEDGSGNSLSAYCCTLAGYNYTGGGCYATLPSNADGFYEVVDNSNLMMGSAYPMNTNTTNSGSNLIMGANNNLYNASMNLVAGVDNNLTNAARSAAIGENHEVSSDNAVAMGKGAIAERSGEIAHGYSSTRGRAQCSTLILTGTTTDANYTELFIDGDSTKKFTVDQDNDSFIGIEANVLAQRRSNHDSMHKYQHTTFRVEAGVGRPVQVGTTSTKTNNKDSGVSSWNNQFSSGGDYIKVEVKGETGATIDWTVILYINEMRL